MPNGQNYATSLQIIPAQADFDRSGPHLAGKQIRADRDPLPPSDTRRRTDQPRWRRTNLNKVKIDQVARGGLTRGIFIARKQ
jgi:hypothetical protein